MRTARIDGRPLALLHALFLFVLVSPDEALAGGGAEYEYDAIELGVPPGAISVIPTRLNDLGHVVGWATFPNATHAPAIHRAWLWTPEAGMTLLPAPPAPLDNYYARDISNAGIIAGDGGLGGGTGARAWRYENGTYTIIGVLPVYGPAEYSIAAGINEAGDVAGTSGDYSGPGTSKSFVLAPYAGGLVELFPGGEGKGINDLGVLIGDIANGGWLRWTKDSGIEELGAGGPQAISNTGIVVGGVGSNSNNSGYAWRYTDDTSTQAIANISNCSSPTFEYAASVNDSGVIVGSSCVVSAPNGWIWTSAQGLRILDDLIDPALPYFLDEPTDVNNAGQIVVRGTTIGDTRAFLLTPASNSSPADLNGDCAVNVVDMLLLLGAWGECPSCPADLDDDGDVDVADFLLLLSAWGPCS